MKHNVQPPDLRAENQALQARIAALLQQAEHNHAMLGRHQAFDLELIAAGSFIELLDSIFHTLPIVSDLDAVTLSLLDEGDDILTVMERLGADLSAVPELLLVHAREQLPAAPGAAPKPRLGRFDAARHGAAFPAAPELASVALVPLLRRQRLIGCLNLGSRDPGRFTPALGTDFIEHMGSIIAICLENVISNEMLKYIGLTDALTGVYNRRYVDRRLLEEIARARRQEYAIGCAYIDIDHFKRINDTLGHQGGDEVLRELARRMRGELRLSDTLARFGGEEFVALLVDADLASAAAAAERIRAVVAGTPFVLADGRSLAVSVSLGVAEFDGAGAAVDDELAARQLLGRADAALYQAKAGGRNRVVSFPSDAAAAPR
jgi:two-component system, cell cycle response regulator